jgi:hypothetical protein
MDKGKKGALIAGAAGVGALIWALFRGKPGPSPGEGLSALYGTVTDSVTGEPVSNATVELWDRHKTSVVVLTTANFQGYYQMVDFDPGSYVVRFSQTGYLPTEIIVMPEEGETRELNVKMQSELTLAYLSGIVTDELGKPIEGVSVSVGASVAFTETSGHYILPDLIPAAEEVAAQKIGYEVTRVHVTLKPGDNPLDLVLISLAVPPTAHTLFYTNKVRSDTLSWGGRVTDLETKNWNIEIRGLGEGFTFEPVGKQLLLVFTEWWSGTAYGPYLVKIGDPGVYNWDARAEKLNGVKATNLAESRNKSVITAKIKGVTIGAQSWVKLKIQSSKPVSGYIDAAQYFDDITVYGAIPDTMEVGGIIQATVWMEPYPEDNPVTSRWYGENFVYVGNFPPKYWIFQGSLAGICTDRTDYGCFGAEIDYSITGTAPNFRWELVYWDYHYTNTYSKRGRGPATGQIRCSGGAILYAHPDPNAELDLEWRDSGPVVSYEWKPVASIDVGSLY